MEAIPVAVGRRIIDRYEPGNTTGAIGAASGYCVAAVRRIRQQFRERGTLAPPRHLRGGKGCCRPLRLHKLGALLVARPDANWAELARQMGWNVPGSTLDRRGTKLVPHSI